MSQVVQTTAVETVATQQPQTVDKVLDFADKWAGKVGEVIEGMARQLGMATEHVYTLYTKQMFYTGLVGVSHYLAVMLSCLLVIFLCFRLTKGKQKSLEDGYWVIRIFGTVIPCFIIGISSVSMDVSTHVLMMLNPEYYTLRDIVDQMSQLIGKGQ